MTAQAFNARGLSRRGPVPGYDATLIAAVSGLLLLGLVMVASASVSIGDARVGQPLYHLGRQSVFVLVGVCAGAVATMVPLAAWRRSSGFMLMAGIALLGLVLIPGLGKEVNGSMRWIALGRFNLQPSELVKVLMWVYLAGYLVRRGDEVRRAFSGFVKPLVLLVLIALLLLLEPDYGAAAVLFATVLGMLFLGGVPLLRFMAWLTVAISVMVAVMVLAPYRVQRLTTFINPWADPFDTGFQLTQALIAVGRGEWFGVGLGSSIQKLFYLPEAHTDFLFSVIGEELGFAGMMLVLLLFSIVVWRAFCIAARAERAGEAYGAYLAYGIGLGIGLQALVNIGVNLGVLPTKGLTLPLMSYGGSSMLASCLAIGLLLRVDHELRREGKRT